MSPQQFVDNLNAVERAEFATLTSQHGFSRALALFRDRRDNQGVIEFQKRSNYLTRRMVGLSPATLTATPECETVPVARNLTKELTTKSTATRTSVTLRRPPEPTETSMHPAHLAAADTVPLTRNLSQELKGATK